MKKIIGLIPTILNRRNSISIVTDYNLVNFIKKCFPNWEIKILIDKKAKFKIDLIISSGGNTLVSFDNSQANIFRQELDDYYFNNALVNNIKFLGICHGAQYVANFFKSEIKKKKNHTKKNHNIYFSNKKKIYVNSYHDYSIITLGKNLEKIAWTEDGSIEAFRHKEKKIFSIMWHPERYKKIKNFDLKLIKKYL